MTTPEGGTAASMAEAAPVDLSPAALRRRYTALFRPKPWLYYADMLGSALLGWSAFAIAVQAHRFSAVWGLALLVATFALYRAVLFIHELSHLQRTAVPGFTTTWQLVVGWPLLV